MLLENDRQRLGHIVKACEEIFAYSQDKTPADVLQDRPIQTLLIYNLQIVGEAASRLSEEFKRSHPEVPWAKMISMRHRMVHDYLRVDLDIVLTTVGLRLPEVLAGVKAILKEDQV